jgi:hypothetical protein
MAAVNWLQEVAGSIQSPRLAKAAAKNAVRSHLELEFPGNDTRFEDSVRRAL